MNDTDQTPQTLFTQDEMRTLQALHTQYQRDHDRFSNRERARLEFLRWLYEAGRLDSPPETRPAGAHSRTGDWIGEPTTSDRPDAEDGGQPE